MTDVFDKNTRSEIMSRIRDRDTSPELLVRRKVHSLGYRYRLHVTSLPGKPDLVLPSHRKVILVHGCFWHRHNCRRGRSTPKTNKRFWVSKLEGNKERDRRNRRRLRAAGWDVLTVWECQTKRLEWVTDRIVRFLES